MTGDLGFMALEPLQKAMGPRFINAGIAEQNMISVAAGLARQDLEVWVYSIAPFCYARPFEQIRNDIVFHDLPVKLIGNGGGYSYGVMGPTHHAIEDYGVLLTLPNLFVYIPIFDEDMEAIITCAGQTNHPSYIRVGRGESPKGYVVPPYAPWRQLTNGGGPVIIATGPLAGSYITPIESLPFNRRPNLWAVSELPIHKNPLPDELIKSIQETSNLSIAEEHVRHGGLGSELAMYLIEQDIRVNRFRHFYAKYHLYETYGSQIFLRRLSGLDADSLLLAMEQP